MTVSSLIYRAAGESPMSGSDAGTCRLCGQPGEGIPFDSWVKDTFTDRDKLAPGTLICRACQFCTAEAAPGLAERVGKDKAQKMRNYSHFVVNGVWHPLSKGDKGKMRILLNQDPAVAVIAESGQKHLLFRARAGWWQFEEQAIRPNVAGLETMLAVLEPLYHGGISKAEIETGRYDQRRIMAVGVEVWRQAESLIRQWRGSSLFDLALFLLQKGDELGT